LGKTGNSFKVRVYPIHPNQSKQVWLKFSSDLTVDGENLQYNLPIFIKDPVNLTVSIAGKAVFSSFPFPFTKMKKRN